MSIFYWVTGKNFDDSEKVINSHLKAIAEEYKSIIDLGYVPDCFLERIKVTLETHINERKETGLGVGAFRRPVRFVKDMPYQLSKKEVLILEAMFEVNGMLLRSHVQRNINCDIEKADWIVRNVLTKEHLKVVTI